MVETKEVIELDLLDDMLEDYNLMKNRQESFSDFIRCTKDDDEDNPPTFVWKLVNKNSLIEVFDE